MKTIGSKVFSLNDFKEAVFGDENLELDGKSLKNVKKGFDFLKKFSSNKLIYGINTGFGPMAQYKVSEDKLLQLQYNLIRSHCSGNGQLLDNQSVKALMVTRLSSLMKGFSGVHTDTVEILKAMINNDVFPCIYEHGGVGASGDLVQLAHLGLVMIGEGEVTYQGKIQSTKSVFKKLNIQPLDIKIREGLAIMNGTAAMTGIGLINVVNAQKLIEWGIVLSSMTNEIINAFDDHFSYELNVVKLHKGQNEVAEAMRSLLKNSKMIRDRSDHLYKAENIDQEIFEDKVQEYYSLRCVTQILGPVLDTINFAEEVLVAELNSVNDNPIIDHQNNHVYHGGNFHGDYVALEMDKLKIAISKLCMLAERQLNYLLNQKLNQKLPPFVNLGTLGFNFGMQGMQFTAVSNTAENQTLSYPNYLHSIPNNNDNQDIVSMGCNGALLTKRVIENTFTVLAIQAMTIVQAIDYLNVQELLSSTSIKIYNKIRSVFPVFVEDNPKHKELLKVVDILKSEDLKILKSLQK